jgi:hypothetical protein
MIGNYNQKSASYVQAICIRVHKYNYIYTYEFEISNKKNHQIKNC